MRRFFLLFILLQSFFIFSQEMGSIEKGEHTLKLFKHNHFYSISFSLDKTDAPKLESAFIFPKKETILRLIESGFKKKNSHQLIVQTSQDTIVKFEFRKFKGNWFLKIKRNNLLNNEIHSSSFFKKEEVLKLFKSTSTS
jgi:hypothetical protein